jgi:hypothetical protein
MGTYVNFVAAVSAAITPGPQGTVAVVGTADWGPENVVQYMPNQGSYDATYSTSTNGSLRDGTLSALDGFDNGGANQAIVYRAVGADGAAGTLVLSDGSRAAALTLTARYRGARINNFYVVVQTNAANSANKDLVLYERGVELERWTNVTGGTNTAFVEALTLIPSEYVTAAISGTRDRALANVVGAIGGAGGFGTGGGGVNGNSGLTLTAGDYVDAQEALYQLPFTAIVLHDVTDDTVLDAFNAFILDYNRNTGRRTFGLVGGRVDETFTDAITRTLEYNNIDMLNLYGAFRRLSDGTVFSSAQFAARFAGAVANVGLVRAATNLKLSDYQVVTPLSASEYEAAARSGSRALGVVVFANDNTQRMRSERAVTTLVNLRGATSLPDETYDHQVVRNVAIDHFVNNTLNDRGDVDVGQLLNTETGRNNFIAAIIDFLKALEDQSILQSGSTVELDTRFDNTGGALFITIGYQYVDAVERFFFTVRVS